MFLVSIGHAEVINLDYKNHIQKPVIIFGDRIKLRKFAEKNTLMIIRQDKY
jgi:hypothetical protein